MANYFDEFIGVSAGKRYSKQTSLSLAVACDLAYRAENTVIREARRWGYTAQRIEFIERVKGRDIDTQCYVMADDKDIIVVFRGSDDIKDWLANFQAVREPGPLQDCLAHEGFQDSLFPAVIALTNVIERMRDNDQKIWCTGHSLGGALCSLYTGMLIENGYKVYGVYTFASPRPGDGNYEKALNSKVTGPHYRVVNTGDIVPHVPPEPFFSHPGKRIILKSRRRETSKRSWFSERVAALKHFIKETGNLLDVADNHRLSADNESYIPRLLADLRRG